MSDSIRTTLGDLVRSGVLHLSDGYRTKRSEHGQPGYRIIRVADVLEGRVIFDSPDFVSENFRRQIGQKFGQPGDILLTTKGTVGRVAILPEVSQPVVYSPQLCYFRVLDDSVIYPRFLRYWFDSLQFRTQASDRMNNTDMAPYINLADIRSLQIDLPTIVRQEVVSEVLGALDDKIASNTGLASTILGLLDEIFFESVRGRDCSSQTFADVATVRGGGTPSTQIDEYWNGEINWATPTDVTGLAAPYLEGTSRRITQAGLDACASGLHAPGSILMTSRATIGAFAIAQQPTAVNQGFIVVNAKELGLQWWLFHEMRSRVTEFVSHANGATFLELSRGNFRKFPVRLADEATMEEFGRKAQIFHQRARAAMIESRELAALRDALLSPLMSGTLRITDTNRCAGEVA